MINEDALGKRLIQFQKMHKLPGLETEESRLVFIAKLMDSQKSLRARSMHKFSGSIEPSKADFHPLKAILEHFQEKRFDEAVWLSFLTTHFGQDERNRSVISMESLVKVVGIGNLSTQTPMRFGNG